MATLVVPQQLSPHFHHWQHFFEKFGCVRCGQKTSAHDRCGFCLDCRHVIVDRLRLILRESR